MASPEKTATPAENGAKGEEDKTMKYLVECDACGKNFERELSGPVRYREATLSWPQICRECSAEAKSTEWEKRRPAAAALGKYILAQMIESSKIREFEKTGEGGLKL